MVLPSAATYNPRGQQTINGIVGNYYFNPSALSNTSALALDSTAQNNAAALIGQFTYGTLGRNSLRGPGSINTDVSIAKHLFLFREKLDAELRGDAFNVFNHANFGTPNTNIESSFFGTVSTTNGPRILQVALHFKF